MCSTLPSKTNTIIAAVSISLLAWIVNLPLLADPSRAGGAFHSQRSGDLLLVSEPSAWFAYYYWKEESQAPDFARCVAIHRKPGYDPAEMFFRYKSNFLGMLYLFFKIFLVYVLHLRFTVDATPLHCEMIRGSHGALPKDDMFKPVYITKSANVPNRIRGENVYSLLLKAVTVPEK